MSLRSDPYKALKYDYNFYLMEETVREIPDPRAEYERMRHQIDIRLRRFERSGLTDSTFYTEYKDLFEDVNTLDNSEVYERIPEMARFSQMYGLQSRATEKQNGKLCGRFVMKG